MSKENIELTVPSIDQTTSPFLFSLLEDREEKVPTIIMPDVPASTLLRFIKSLIENDDSVGLNVETVYSMLGMSFGILQDDLEVEYIIKIETPNVDERPPVKEALLELNINDDIEREEEAPIAEDIIEGEYRGGGGKDKNCNMTKHSHKKPIEQKSDKISRKSVLTKQLSMEKVSTDNKGLKHVKQRHGLTSIAKYEKKLCDGKVYTDDYNFGCRTKCEICSKEMSTGYLRQHIVWKHGVTLEKYKKTFGSRKFVRKTFHQCKICDLHEELQRDEKEGYEVPGLGRWRIMRFSLLARKCQLCYGYFYWPTVALPLFF